MSFSEKKTNISKSIEGKFPKLHSKTTGAFYYVKDVWQETFPNEERNVRNKIEKRKELARMQKEMEENQEYID